MSRDNYTGWGQDPYAADLRLLEPVLDRHADDPDALTTILGEAQSLFGYLPLAALPQIARSTNRSVSAVHHVASMWARSKPSRH